MFMLKHEGGWRDKYMCASLKHVETTIKLNVFKSAVHSV